MYQILQKFDIHWHDGGPSITMMYHLRRVSDLLCNWKSCLLCYMKDVVLHCSIFFKWNKLVRVRVRVRVRVQRVKCIAWGWYLGTSLVMYSSWVQIIIWYLISAKPLSQPMVTSHRTMKNFLIRNVLWNWDIFIQWNMVENIFMNPIDWDLDCTLISNWRCEVLLKWCSGESAKIFIHLLPSLFTSWATNVHQASGACDQACWDAGGHNLMPSLWCPKTWHHLETEWHGADGQQIWDPRLWRSKNNGKWKSYIRNWGLNNICNKT